VPRAEIAAHSPTVFETTAIEAPAVETPPVHAIEPATSNVAHATAEIAPTNVAHAAAEITSAEIAAAEAARHRTHSPTSEIATTKAATAVESSSTPHMAAAAAMGEPDHRRHRRYDGRQQGGRRLASAACALQGVCHACRLPGCHRFGFPVRVRSDGFSEVIRVSRFISRG